MMPKIEERLTICASGCFDRCGRKARVPCTTPQKLMLISHSICAWSTSSNVAEQRHAGIVDDDVERGMRRDGGLREILDLRGLADIDAVRRDLARACLADLGGERLQSGLVAIGQREVAAARGQFQRQRAADAAGGAGDGGRASGNRSHSVALHAGRRKAGGFPRTFANWNRTIKRFRRLTSTTRQKASPDRRKFEEALWDNQTLSRDRAGCRRRSDAAGDDLPAAGGERDRRHRMRKRGGRRSWCWSAAAAVWS